LCQIKNLIKQAHGKNKMTEFNCVPFSKNVNIYKASNDKKKYLKSKDIMMMALNKFDLYNLLYA
jgi:hypothetical protein